MDEVQRRVTTSPTLEMMCGGCGETVKPAPVTVPGVNKNRRKYEIFSLESVRRDILGIARVPSESGCRGGDVAHVTCHVSVSGVGDHVTSSRVTRELSRRWHPRFSVTTTSLFLTIKTAKSFTFSNLLL